MALKRINKELTDLGRLVPILHQCVPRSVQVPGDPCRCGADLDLIQAQDSWEEMSLTLYLAQ